MISTTIGRSALAAALVSLLLPATAQAGPLGIAGGYGEFVFGDLSRGNTNSGGAIAAGGSATLANMRIGGSGSTGLVVGGDLSWKNGSLGSGAAFVGGQASTRGVKPPDGIKDRLGDTPIDFLSARSHLEEFSRAQHGDPTAKASYDGHYWYGFGSADARGLQIVDVDASALKGKGLKVAGAVGSTVIVNVLGDSASFQNMRVELAGGIAASNVLWNFVDATSLSLSNVGWAGTILAPRATVGFDNGQLSGALIAAALKGNGSVDIIGYGGASALFAGDARLLQTPGPIPEPASIVMLSAAMAAALGAATMRRRRFGFGFGFGFGVRVGGRAGR